MSQRSRERVGVRLRRLTISAAAVGLIGCSGPDAAPPTTVAPTTTSPSEIEDDSLAISVAADGVVSSREVAIEWRVGASIEPDEMQLTTDASFTTAVWEPYTPQAVVEVVNNGYQTIFGRLRTDRGEVLTTATGVTIDPDWDAATSGATGRQRASWAALVAPNVLQVRVETGRLVRGVQEPYDFGAPSAGDELGTDDSGVTSVTRDGSPLGRQVGDLDILKRWDVVLGAGSGFDPTQLDIQDGFSLGGTAPVSASRVSRPIGEANTPSGQAWPMSHDVFLTFSESVPTTSTLELTFPGGVVEPLAVTIDPTSDVSPAVQVNQVGYRPHDIAKVAFYSTWTGEPGGLVAPDGLPFSVRNLDGDVVHTGSSTVFTPPADGEWGRGDLTGAQVHRLDFTSFDEPGRYRICVDEVGCSFDFSIGEDDTWLQAFIGVARSMYHQRSNIAMGPPYTSVVRPEGGRSAGMEAQRVSLTLLDDPQNVGIDDRFDEYPGAVTGEVVSDVRGGHFDAGDWNMRISHLRYLRVAIDLVEVFPERFADLDLNIPESGDAVPDLVDEGLWDLDLYLRLQSPDGGVAGMVDYESFPTRDLASWQNDAAVYVTSPDAWSSYLFAAAAADAARLLAEIDAERAATYAAAAERAMTWAESQELAPEVVLAVADVRGTAAAAMLRLTGDDRWNDVFVDATEFDDGPVPLLGCLGDDECDAAWTYARAGSALTRPDVFNNVLSSFDTNAAILAAASTTTAYGWSLEHPDIPMVFGLGPATPRGVGLLRAEVLLGDRDALAAATRAASFSLGANPLNTSFVTGFGSSAVRNPLVIDAIHGASPVWAGTPVFGPHDLAFGSDDDWIVQFRLDPAGTTPSADSMPFLRSFYDLGGLPPMNEFTVNRSHASALWVFGVLAAQEIR